MWRLVSASVLLPSTLVGDAQPAGPAFPDAAVVETLAGPTFCRGTGIRDPGSGRVGSLALDGSGAVYFETGSRAAPTVARVGPDGLVTPLHVGELAAEARAAASSRLAPDGEGGVLMAAGARILQIDARNAVRTFAGERSLATAGARRAPSDGTRPLSEARFLRAQSIASDAAGNLYVTDQADRRLATFRVRLINRSSAVMTVYGGTPHERRIPPGHIATIAGIPIVRPATDGVPAVRATLRGQRPSVAVAGPLLYVTSTWSNTGDAGRLRVRIINVGSSPVSAHGALIAPGSVMTVRERERRAILSFSSLPGLAADGGGNLFLADEHRDRVLRVDDLGGVDVFAGGASVAPRPQLNGDGGPASRARLARPFDVKIGREQRVYIADQSNNQIRVVDGNGTIQTVAGGWVAPKWVCRQQGEAKGSVPVRGAPSSVAVGADGTTFVALPDAAQVQAVLAPGWTRTVAGLVPGSRPCPPGRPCPNGDGGPAAQARLTRPSAIAVTGAGGLYILDVGDARVRFVNLGRAPVVVHGVRVEPGQIETVAGNGKSGFSGDGGSALRAELATVPMDDPQSGLLEQLNFLSAGVAGSIAVDGEGSLFVADTANSRVRVIDSAGIITTLLEGSEHGEGERCCNKPTALALDSAENLVVSESLGSDVARRTRVWILNRTPAPIRAFGQEIAPGEARVVAGSGLTGFGGDGGAATEAQLYAVWGVTSDSQGNLYLAEVGPPFINRDGDYIGAIGGVRHVDATGTIRTILGNGQARFNGDGLHPRLTSLSFPTAVAVDSCGRVLIADMGNDRLRRVESGVPCSTRQPAADRSRPPASPSRAPLVVAASLAALLGTALAAHRIRSRSGRSDRA